MTIISARALRSTFWRVYGNAAQVWSSNRPILDLAGGPERTVFVAGSARSGTTWVGSVVSSMLRARPIFEPLILNSRGAFAFAHERFPAKADLRRSYQLYIRPSLGPRTPYYEEVGRILAGRVRGPWVDAEARAGLYRERVVKDIRANLYLDWIQEAWPGLRLIWVIRNPLAVIQSQVAHSQQRGKFDWDAADLLGQPDVVED